ncbi:hypothetical protein VB834_15055 [Limnoraphis robusta Tam1]|uniref:hypothetical protein n=1 Tax=Limnoraphis robusta TaxID=1118279 RepID=UPI002B1EF687|nr:hypothetical protein [Limnoraphis robusta]MEA5498317.1 hypothetical protein [Limnoraphis robusta BA-68 BA1]MEA5540342.1 hypothetical protein [Limnoraphis robusta Tam1]
MLFAKRQGWVGSKALIGRQNNLPKQLICFDEVNLFQRAPVTVGPEVWLIFQPHDDRPRCRRFILSVIVAY